MTARFVLPPLVYVLPAVALLAGCASEGPELATVAGTVTLDGRPLAAATVEFQPAGGSPSQGVTDEAGRYALKYTAKKAGATLGSHVVRIANSGDGDDGRGDEPQPPRPRIPARYNQKSELKADVKSGSNTIDFALTSK